MPVDCAACFRRSYWRRSKGCTTIGCKLFTVRAFLKKRQVWVPHRGRRHQRWKAKATPKDVEGEGYEDKGYEDDSSAWYVDSDGYELSDEETQLLGGLGGPR